jgi:hypothetical protein
MRTALVGLALLVVVPSLDAVPAPDPGRLPKQKLEALKKKLPALLADWAKERKNVRWLPNAEWTCSPELRVLRRVGTDRAKAVIFFAAFDQKGVREPLLDVLLTVFLTYYDDCWTTDRFESADRRANALVSRSTFAFLMADIDEAAEKP